MAKQLLKYEILGKLKNIDLQDHLWLAAWVEISTLLYWSTVVTRVDCSKNQIKYITKS